MTRMIRRLTPVVGCIALVGLSACVTVLPKQAPVQLYRFGGDNGAVATTDRPTPVASLEIRTSLPAAASGDQLLAVTGGQAAYIAGARWNAPATLMFMEATQSALRTQAPQVTTTSGVAAAGPRIRLQLDLETFEVDYLAGASAPPTVHILASVTLSDVTGRVERSFRVDSRVAAKENRVASIVAAYDASVGEVLASVSTAVRREADADAAAAAKPR